MSEKINRIDEHWRDNLLGMKFSKGLQKQILKRHSLDTQLIRTDIQKELVKDALKGSPVELLPSIYEGVMVAVTDPKTKKILDVNFNTPQDLCTDNFGKWFAGLFQPPTNWYTNGGAYVSLRATSGTYRSVYTYFMNAYLPTYYGVFNKGNSLSVGALLQIGSSTTNPARTDYTIGTAFGTAPESALQNVSQGIYDNAGNIGFGTALAAGGNGTVNETGFIFYWIYGTPTASDYFMMFHDKLDSGVNFVAGNLINVCYLISL